MIAEFFKTTFTILWVIGLVVFLFYFLTTVIFRLISYPLDRQKFAGNSINQRNSSDFIYYIIIPCYNEEAIIKRTLTQALAFAKVEVVVVDDASSDNSLAEINQLHNPHLHVLKRQEPEAHTGKGDVLNFGLNFIIKDSQIKGFDKNKVIVGVIDADAQLAPNAITCLNNYFTNPEAVITQMRVKMYPNFKSLLQVFQDVEFFSVNNMAQIMRMYTRTVGLSGNGQFFRLSTILNKIGDHPWGDALLDDYEMTIRLMLVGITVDYMAESYVYQEALISVKKFIIQRSRWVQGDLDCLKYLPNLIKDKSLTKTQKLGIYYFLAQPWLAIIADISLIVLSLFTGVVVGQNVGEVSGVELTLILFLTLTISCFCGILELIIYQSDLHHFKEKSPRFGKMIVIIGIVSYVYVILFFSLLIAFKRWFTHKNSWVKTEHGKGS